MLGLLSALVEALTRGATSGLKGLQSSLGSTFGVLAISTNVLNPLANGAALLNNAALSVGNIAGSAAQTSLHVAQQTTSAVLSTGMLIVKAPLEAAAYAAQPAGALWQGTYQVAGESIAGFTAVSGKIIGATVGAVNPVNPFVPGTEGFNLPGGRGGGSGGFNPKFLSMQRATSNMMMQQQSQMATMAAARASQNA